MTRRAVYLSGRIDGLHYDEAVAKRSEATKLLVAAGWDVLDPMRGKTDLTGGVITDGSTNRSDAEIVLRDIDDMRRCDVMLVLTGDTPSYGTEMEWGYVGIALRKPIVAVDEAGTARKSPWPRYHTMFFGDTVAEACEWLIGNLDRDYQLD